LLDGKPVGVRFECVKKTTFPDRFPLTVFATARRRLQAAIRNASAIVTRSFLSGYSVRVRVVRPSSSESFRKIVAW
jgi:hypothetical protein